MTTLGIVKFFNKSVIREALALEVELPPEVVVAQLQATVADQAKELAVLRRVAANINHFVSTKFTGNTDRARIPRDMVAAAVTGCYRGNADPDDTDTDDPDSSPQPSAEVLSQLTGLTVAALRKAYVCTAC